MVDVPRLAALLLAATSTGCYSLSHVAEEVRETPLEAYLPVTSRLWGAATRVERVLPPGDAPAERPEGLLAAVVAGDRLTVAVRYPSGVRLYACSSQEAAGTRAMQLRGDPFPLDLAGRPAQVEVAIEALDRGPAATLLQGRRLRQPFPGALEVVPPLPERRSSTGAFDHVSRDPALHLPPSPPPGRRAPPEGEEVRWSAPWAVPLVGVATPATLVVDLGRCAVATVLAVPGLLALGVLDVLLLFGD